MTLQEYRFVQLSSSKFNNIKFKVNVGAENCLAFRLSRLKLWTVILFSWEKVPFVELE